MKTKTFSKKLVLKKDTIADLNTDELKVAHGGGTIFLCTMFPCRTIDPPSKCSPCG
jgi:hypothetical protein